MVLGKNTCRKQGDSAKVVLPHPKLLTCKAHLANVPHHRRKASKQYVAPIKYACWLLLLLLLLLTIHSRYEVLCSIA
jgi:hypothetical protein